MIATTSKKVEINESKAKTTNVKKETTIKIFALKNEETIFDDESIVAKFEEKKRSRKKRKERNKSEKTKIKFAKKSFDVKIKF